MEPAASSRRGDGAGSLFPAIVVLVLLAGFALAWLLREHRAEVEVRALPAQQRQALYQRTLETLRSTCAEVDGASLGEYCQEQAELITRFPECDAPCRSLADRYASIPSR